MSIKLELSINEAKELRSFLIKSDFLMLKHRPDVQRSFNDILEDIIERLESELEENDVDFE